MGFAIRQPFVLEFPQDQMNRLFVYLADPFPGQGRDYPDYRSVIVRASRQGTWA